ncbi:MAG TPA: lysophospholipid acyltransferase family protein [Bryobacteraceae bacterium]|nr:lysophospholipid acyltransferase family protein [Bryobacteraceae bacterium]
MRAIEYWAARFAIATVARFPPLARVYIRLLDLLVPRFRRTARKNLSIAGICEDGVIDGMFRSIARMLETFARFPRITRENVHDLIRYDGLEHFKNALARGRGVLVATAHFGNWELSAFAHALMTAPMHVVARPLDNRRLDEFIEQRRAMSGNRIISKREAAREILRALKSGQAVGILIDQNTAREEGVFVDFFGVKACAGTGFVKLAHHSGAAVVPGYALWSAAERRYVLRFDPEIPMSGGVPEDTQKIHSHLEKVIRKHADQYLWIHRRWKTRPPGEPPLY